MALRSLPGKLKGFFRARTTSFSPAAAAAASEEPVKLMGSEARPRAILKQVRGRQRLRDDEFDREIRKGYRIMGVVSVAVVGSIAFTVSYAVQALDELRHSLKEEMFALMRDETCPIDETWSLEEVIEYIRDEMHMDMDAKGRVEGNVMDAKEESKALDAKKWKTKE